MRKFAALTLSVATVGASWLAMSPADAHTPDISASCSGVHVGATAYDSNVANRWSVTINGATQSGTFGDSFDQTFPVPQAGATTQWSAFVEAADGTYHGDGSGTVGPCGTPPPVDVCTDLPGPQPVGTQCTPPPDVQRADAKDLEGCAVSFGGTAYGAGDLTYDEQYTDSYVFNQSTNTWDLVTDTTATIANVVFTPWSVQEQVDHGCTAQPTQPPAEHSSHQSTHLDCDDDVQVTTIVTTTTPYVYDAATNTWVPGQPVEHTTTHEQPVQQGDCDDTEVLGTQAHVHHHATHVVAASAGTPQVPTSVDAGLAGSAPVSAPVRADGSASATQSNGSQLPALLLLMAGAAFALGAFRLRRS
jgi:hypothetical protein